METYRRLEDLIVYQKLCRLHIEIGELPHRWPAEEKYELGSQARRSSNSNCWRLTVAGPIRPCGKMARTDPHFVDFLNPEPCHLSSYG